MGVPWLNAAGLVPKRAQILTAGVFSSGRRSGDQDSQRGHGSAGGEWTGGRSEVGGVAGDLGDAKVGDVTI